MIMDLIILGIFVICLVVSMIRGFALTIIGFCKGIASLVVSWIFCDDLAEYLTTNTAIGENVEAKINSYLTSKWETSQIYQSLPELFKNGSGDFSQSIINGGSEKLASLFMTILCFILIWVAIKIVLILISHLFSKKHRDGAVKKVDTFLGFIFGVVSGVFYVYLFLALLVPVTGFIIPNQTETIMGWFEGARVAQWMYDNNLLLILFRDLLLKA